MKIPWKLKSKLFKVLGFFPSNTLYLIQRLVTRRAKVRASEIKMEWKHHRKIIEKTGARQIIEFGAGKSLVQNLYLASFVDHQIVVDLFPMMNINLVNEAIHKLGDIGAEIDGRPVTSSESLEDIYNIRYLAPYDMQKTDLPDGSIDLCISTNTLEHIPPHNIAAIFSELLRVLRPRGNVSAVIDYSDHYAHSDPSIGRLNYLRYTEKEWQKHNHGNHFQNRLRHAHYREIFKNVGFEIVAERTGEYCDPAGNEFIDELLTGDETDFYTTGFWHLRTP